LDLTSNQANDYRTQVQVGEALKASGLSREQVFVTTKCPGAIGFNATLQCTSAESLEDSMATLEKADASNGEMPLQ